MNSLLQYCLDEEYICYHNIEPLYKDLTQKQLRAKFDHLMKENDDIFTPNSSSRLYFHKKTRRITLYDDDVIILKTGKDTSFTIGVDRS